MPDAVPQNVTTAAPTGTPSITAAPAAGALDPKIVNLAQAIRQTESQGNFQATGKSGEYGAYQFLPSTWNETAPSFGVNVPLQQATPEQQNEVAYKQLATWAQQHPDWNIGNFASAWNAGAGKPNAYLENNVGTNAEGVSYDTPTYAKNVATAYQQIKAQSQGGTGTTPISTAPASAAAPPSIGGFLQNTVESGANFLGNLGNAVLHPIQTVQGLGGAVVGGLQEAGGQTNENTANFDNVGNYFKNRYGSVNDLAHTAYTDPVGLAADLSAALGVGEGAVSALGKVGDITAAGRLGTAADIARESGSAADFITTPEGVSMPTAGVSNPITSATRAASGVLGKASELTNPLSPLIAGANGLINAGGDSGVLSNITSKVTGMDTKTIDQIVNNPEAFTPEEIANTSRTTVANQVKEALDEREATLSETGSHYGAVRSDNTEIPVAKNFLEDQLRKEAGVDIKDGEIVTKGAAKIRDAKDVKALQNLFDTWKPEFQKGYLTTEEFLNFRQDLAGAAKFDKEFTSSKPVESLAASVRSNLNAAYRGHISGLEDIDADYAAQRSEFDDLKKGIIDKNGDLLDSAVNSIANSGGIGKDAKLARLEELVPGITKKLQVLKAIEDIKASMGNKIGTYTSAALKGGGVVAGLATGSMPTVAAAIATSIIASPDVAVPILRALGNNRALVSTVMAHLARYATLSAVGSRATSQGTLQSTPLSESPTDSESQPDTESPNP